VAGVVQCLNNENLFVVAFKDKGYVKVVDRSSFKKYVKKVRFPKPPIK
jgi:hypothetical protein